MLHVSRCLFFEHQGVLVPNTLKQPPGRKIKMCQIFDRAIKPLGSMASPTRMEEERMSLVLARSRLDRDQIKQMCMVAFGALGVVDRMSGGSTTTEHPAASQRSAATVDAAFRVVDRLSGGATTTKHPVASQRAAASRPAPPSYTCTVCGWKGSLPGSLKVHRARNQDCKLLRGIDVRATATKEAPSKKPRPNPNPRGRDQAPMLSVTGSLAPAANDGPPTKTPEMEINADCNANANDPSKPSSASMPMIVEKNSRVTATGSHASAANGGPPTKAPEIEIKADSGKANANDPRASVSTPITVEKNSRATTAFHDDGRHAGASMLPAPEMKTAFLDGIRYARASFMSRSSLACPLPTNVKSMSGMATHGNPPSTHIAH